MWARTVAFTDYCHLLAWSPISANTRVSCMLILPLSRHRFISLLVWVFCFPFRRLGASQSPSVLRFFQLLWGSDSDNEKVFHHKFISSISLFTNSSESSSLLENKSDPDICLQISRRGFLTAKETTQGEAEIFMKGKASYLGVGGAPAKFIHLINAEV